MPLRVRRAAATLFLVALSACASGGTGSHTAPQLVGNDYPSLSTSGRPEPVRVALTMMINPDGSADLSTLKITGTVNAEQRDAVAAWAARSRFTPGMSAGQPVRAEYTLDMRTKIVTRTM